MDCEFGIGLLVACEGAQACFLFCTCENIRVGTEMESSSFHFRGVVRTGRLRDKVAQASGGTRAARLRGKLTEFRRQLSHDSRLFILQLLRECFFALNALRFCRGR